MKKNNTHNNWNSRLLFLVILFIPYITLHAEANPLIGKSRINDFVLYHDNRQGNALLGFLYQDNNTYIIRKYDLNTKEEVICKIAYEISDELIKTKECTILSGKDNNINELMMDFMLIIMASTNVDRTKYPNDIHYPQYYGPENNKTNQEIIFKYWVPLFGIFKIVNNGNPNSRLQLMDFSCSGESEPKRFYKTVSLLKYVEGPSYKITYNKRSILEYKFLKFHIDDNWKEKNDTLVISNVTKQDAQIGFNYYNVKKNSLGMENLCLLKAKQNMLDLPFPVIAETVKVIHEMGYVTFEYYIINPIDQMTTHVFDIFRYNDIDELCNIRIFSYGSLYNANIEYFENMLIEIRKQS